MKITDVRVDRLKVRGNLVRVYTDECLVGMMLNERALERLRA